MTRTTLIALLKPWGNTEAATGGVLYSVLRNFAKFTGKHLCRSLFFNKLQ